MIKNVTILTGFLGSGKTTLLNTIIKANKETQYAIIENEIGIESIDAQLVLSPANQLIEINDGCLCCSLGGELISALEVLIKRLTTWDELIIEATGVADPANIALPFLTEPTFADFFRLQRVICVVDAEQVEDQLKETTEAIKQISFADILLVNKTELISEAYLHQILGILKSINPFAMVIPAKINNMGIEEIFSMERNPGFIAHPKPAFTPKGMLNLSPLSGQRATTNSGPIVVQSSHRQHQHSDIETILLRFSIPMDLDELEQRLRVFLFLQSRGVYRIKGIISAEGYPHRIIIQSVGQRLAITQSSLWQKNQNKESKIVIIGKDLQLKGFEKIFSSCLSELAC